MKDKCLFVAKVKKGTGEKRWSQKKTPDLRKIEILSENDQERKDGRESYPASGKKRKEREKGREKIIQEIGKATDCEIGTKTKLRMGEKCQDKKLRT